MMTDERLQFDSKAPARVALTVGGVLLLPVAALFICLAIKGGENQK